MNIELPIYYAAGKGKMQLVGMNWYRNAHFHQQHAVKKHYHGLIREAVGKYKGAAMPRFYTGYSVFMKNAASDPSNVVAIFEKFWLDALQDAGVIMGDSAKYHAGSSGYDCNIDKENPRIICSVFLEL
jgi:hypothetical protein